MYQPFTLQSQNVAIPTYSPYVSHQNAFSPFYAAQPTYLENTEPLVELPQENIALNSEVSL